MLLGEVGQVVAPTEALAGPLHHDHVNLVVRVGPLDGGADLGGHVLVDGVQALGPVQQQASHARKLRILFDLDGAVVGHLGSLGADGGRPFHQSVLTVGVTRETYRQC
ncbi:hypothetical protein D3C71_1973460 [compost metagenome]